MALQFSHAVGYRGLCSINGQSVLCTGGNINLTQEPIMGSGVWGAGYQNAAPVAYAWNYLNLQGSANYELTLTDSGASSSTEDEDSGGASSSEGVWGALKEAAFTTRVNAANIVLKPDGKNGFSGNGWISSLSFEASEGSVISGSFNFKGDPSGNSITATGTGDVSKYGVGGASQSAPSPFAGSTLVPYWRTNVSTLEGDISDYTEPITNEEKVIKDIISWSCSYNSDIQMLKCCNLEANSPKRADYILLGDMTGDCNYTVFTLKGDFDPNKYHNQKKNLSFNIGKQLETDASSASQGEGYDEHKEKILRIVIPLAIVNSASTSMATGASYITAEYSFTALGNGKGSLMNMCSSK